MTIPPAVRERSTVRDLTGVVLRGAAGNLATSGLGALLLVGSQLFLARFLGAIEFGYFLYSLTVLSVLGVVSRVGVDTALVRYVAAYSAQRDWSRLAGIVRFGDRFVLGVGSVVAATTGLVVWLLRATLDPHLTRALWVTAVMLPVAGGAIYLRAAVLQGLRRAALVPLPDAIVRPGLLLIVTSTLYSWRGSLTAVEALWSNLAAAVGGVLVGSLLIRASLPKPVRSASPVSEARAWTRTSWPLWLVAGMRFLMNQTDILLLGILVDTTTAGIYGVASRLARLVTFGLSAANSISAPLISELHSRGDVDALQRMVTFTCRGTTLWSLLFAGAVIVFSSPLLALYGQEFRAGAPVLLVLAVGQIVNGATGPVGFLLNMTGHERVNARILAWIAGANLVLNPPAILLFGALGAALVTATLGAVKNLLTWWVARDRLGVDSSVFG
jgi:O-antigen/teichoic acid export membrane protein